MASMMSVARVASPRPRPAAPHADAALARRCVLSLAGQIDPDADAVMHWYHDVAIDELWGRTARELVDAGEGRRVLSFLGEVASGRRD